MPSIAIESLPQYEQISHDMIREAAAQLSVAAAAKDTARKDLVELEQTREAAEWRDAEAAEQARAESKPEPKRTHVAAHDRKTDAARHELKVSQLTLERARDALESALDEHGQAWADELVASVEALTAEWSNSVEGLIALHGRLSSTLPIARTVVGKQASVRTLRFPAREIHDLELAGGQRDPHGVIDTAGVLGALSRLLERAPEPQPIDRKPKPLPSGQGSNLLRGRGDVEEEIAERQAFAERAASPKAVAVRRARREELQRSNEAAIAIEAGQ